jgi:subtilisin family serine protease
VNNDKDPMDDHYDGTHCAGTIGAVGHNGIGVAGVCHTVKLMPLKFLSTSGRGSTSDAIEAVLYATDNGATLTSNSWGGGGYSQALKNSIDAAQAAGILFVAAAGNDSENTDAVASYSASYSSANIISVAATDHEDTLAHFSNFGAITVDLAAPGVSVYSTSPGNSYRSLSGTSMACPNVAGACALLISARPSMIWSDVKTALLNNVDPIASLAGKVTSAGRVNVARSP